jgi:hypothetical protein
MCFRNGPCSSFSTGVRDYNSPPLNLYKMNKNYTIDKDTEFEALFGGKFATFGRTEAWLKTKEFLEEAAAKGRKHFLRSISACIQFFVTPKDYLMSGVRGNRKIDENGVSEALIEYLPHIEKDMALASNRRVQGNWQVVNFENLRRVALWALHVVNNKVTTSWKKKYGDPATMSPEELKRKFNVTTKNWEENEFKRYSILAEDYSDFQEDREYWSVMSLTQMLEVADAADVEKQNARSSSQTKSAKAKVVSNKNVTV